MSAETRVVNKRLNSVTWRETDKHAQQAIEIAYALDGIGFIAGGMARWLLAGPSKAPEPSDIDVFCNRPESYRDVQNALKALGYRFWMLQGSAEAWSRDPFAVAAPRDVADINDAATFRKSEGFEAYTGELTVQIVPPRGEHNEQRRFGSPQEVIADFTFVVEQFAVYADDPAKPLRCVYTGDALADLTYKRIRLNKCVSPIYTTYRIAKYGKKGFRITIAESMKLFAAWDALPVATRGHMMAVDPFGGDVYRELGGLS